PPDIYLRTEAEGATSIQLQSMGSGIAELVIILASLEEDRANEVSGAHYHMEEPECHLHPKLLRRFMALLPDYGKAQFFFSSHSSVVLDSLPERGKIYLFSQTAKGNCKAELAQGVVAHHDALDVLGISGSSLLQANCAIWVEGPSDRLYLREWL